MVLEVTSRSTRREDQGRKKGVYASPLTVRPDGGLPAARLQGAAPSELRNNATADVGANMFLYYEENNPRAVVAPDVFVKGSDLFYYSEWAKEHAREGAVRKAAEDRAAREGAARKAAEARIAELETLLRNLRG